MYPPFSEKIIFCFGGGNGQLLMLWNLLSELERNIWRSKDKKQLLNSNLVGIRMLGKSPITQTASLFQGKKASPNKRLAFSIFKKTKNLNFGRH